MNMNVIKSKYNELCLSIYLRLLPLIKDFNSKLRSYFSQQQKEVIKNIKSDSISYSYFYDTSKYVEKLIKLYSEQSVNAIKLGLDRGKAESDSDYTKDLLQYLSEQYTTSTITTIATYIENTTIKILNKLYKKYVSGEISKSEFIDKVNEYYNSDFKSWRSKEIAQTEIYRAFHFAYFTFMVSQGYYYKKYIACFNSPDSKSKLIHNQVKFYLEEFYIPLQGCTNCKGLFPPLHPNSRATILMLKSPHKSLNNEITLSLNLT